VKEFTGFLIQKIPETDPYHAVCRARSRVLMPARGHTAGTHRRRRCVSWIPSNNNSARVPQTLANALALHNRKPVMMLKRAG
jgi:hypothetical protein